MSKRALCCLLLLLLLAVPCEAALPESLSELVPNAREPLGWHALDRKHVLDLLEKTTDIRLTADALYIEWLEITRALVRELESSVRIHPRLGARIYSSVATGKILVLSLAKRARETLLSEIVRTGSPGTVSEAYLSLFSPGPLDGTWIDAFGLRVPRAPVAATVEECFMALDSLSLLPLGALRGFGYFLAPYVFKHDSALAFTSHQPGPEEWVGISAMEPGQQLEGWPFDTIIHETGHLVHFEYFGTLAQSSAFWSEYQSIRGKPLVSSGAWEHLTEENFAEDFRVTFSQSRLPHRGSYGHPDDTVKQQIVRLVTKAVEAGPSGRVKLADIVMRSGDLTLPVISAPATTGVLVTRDAEVRIAGNAQSLAPDVRPSLSVVRPEAGKREAWVFDDGPFSVSLALDDAPGVYKAYRAMYDPKRRQWWDYHPGLSIIKMGPESMRLGNTGAHWSRGDVAVMLAIGALDGYPDGTVRPDNAISRAEFVKMLCRVTGTEPSREPHPFSDLSSHWSEPYISAAHQAGWLAPSRYGSRFDPDRRLGRAEMAVIVATALRAPTGAACGFADVAPPDSTAVGYLALRGIVQGTRAGTFEPSRQTTRGEAATVLARLRKALLEP